MTENQMKHPFRKIKSTLRQYREARKLMRAPGYRFVRAFSPGHYYSPVPSEDDIEEIGFYADKKNVKELPGINLREVYQISLIEEFRKIYGELPWPPEGEDADEKFRYRFDNIYFSYGDAVTLYLMMRHFEPKRIIEVGSGFSSGAMLDVDERFLDGETEFTFIEPYPERLRELLFDEDLDRVSILNQPVQKVDLSEFERLKDGDILFIDSSHVSKTGSDVNFLIHCVLPALKPGVIIHFHDIFWPFEYPQKWLKSGRAWNEAYLVRAFLQYNAQFEILFFNSFMEHQHRKMLREKLPLMLRQPKGKMTFGNSSLWLRKK